ncbi:efflux RND transporter periplasmic adaptor subunit [Candidatus Sumerlaeota bacterium]|nr:efflux RND transporter periplasmic adaptor subunit [Candidatus Sumerlaeota bacterium]
MKRFVVFLAGLCALAGLFAGLFFFTPLLLKADVAGAPDEDLASRLEKARGVKILTMFPMPLEDVLMLPGSVEAYDDITLSTKLAGVIEECLKEEGESIQEGETLVRLDIADLQAELERASSQYDHDKRQYERKAELLKEKVVSQEAYDEAALNLRRSEAALKAAKVMVERGEIRSPITGVLDRRPVDPGEYIMPGAVVARLVNIGKIKVVIEIPEKDVLYFQQGDEAGIQSGIGDGSELLATGRIEYLARSASERTRTFTAKIVVDNTEGRLRPGMIVRARLVRRTNPKALAAPFFALVDREDGKSVFIERDGVALERHVSAGIIRRGLIEIASGLEEGDNLIVVGQRELVNGELVRVEQDLTPLAQNMVASGQDLSALVMRAYKRLDSPTP